MPIQGRSAAAPTWPDGGGLIAVRHAQSLANVAFAEAEVTEAEPPDLGQRDADVALSRTGRAQVAALGRWLADQPDPPRIAYCSTYLRARQTWEIAARELDPARTPVPRLDHRLRDREMGELELLPPTLIWRRYPVQARLRRELGDLRYRPPGGENLADVAERVRGFLAGIDPADRPMIVTHDAVILMLRQIIEPMPEPELLRLRSVANASITRWTVRAGSPRLVAYGDVAHLSRLTSPR